MCENIGVKKEVDRQTERERQREREIKSKQTCLKTLG